MSRLELQLLGVPEVRFDGTPIVLTRRSSLALLAYLVVSGGTHPREQLTALFGGDGTEDQARRRLSNALADLRQQLAPCLLASWHVVGMRPDLSYTSDVHQFEAHLVHVRERDDAASLRAAADLYRGEFLAGLTLAGAPDFEMWLLLHRESYHAQFVQTLEGLVASATRRSAWAEGVWAAQRLVELEPWHEEAHRQLMLFLARSGQRHVALAQFDICRRVLREELDTEPADETVAVYEGLKRGSMVANNLPAQTTECVGREVETELLLNQLGARESRLITIVGPPGSGKSRLAVEAAVAVARAERPGSTQAFRVGVFIVPAGSDVAEQLPMAIARTVGLDDGRGTLDSSELAALLATQSVLLVLDGVDNTPSTIDLVAELVVRGPGVTVLVTALAPLRVEGEHVLTIGGLDVPARPEDLERAAAGALLLAEARRADLRFRVAQGARASLVQVCHLVHGLPLGLILAARALPEVSSANLVGAIESALTAPSLGNRRAQPWWNSPQWASVLDTLELLERPHGGYRNGSAGRGALPGKPRRVTPLAVVCTPDAHAEELVERLRHEGMVVCLTNDFHGCLRVATSVGPDVILIDPRMPRRLEQLLRAHPTSGSASIRWLTETSPARAPRVRLAVG
ncbi:MAG TPA: BTAD domain-containing putative transcriptional regulator [Chloroflexota bacterium]|nr:BTAD domain-containing putative transcriptional regulator [Chloroflexota bacterium]